jgi:DNA-directed RNA polymerase subunit RPC12/RpoP
MSDEKNSLPFQKPDPGVRKYVCFVCGRHFPEYEPMRQHILSSHEEGREYVRCPLERCGCPVRDVRAHMRAKHPRDPIPKTCQLKSVVWLDPKTMTRSRKPVFREGYYVSQKNGGKSMHYRSGMECQVYECLEANPAVAAWDVEPFAVPYTFEGEQRRYFPDLIVQLADGRTEVWEVKPGAQTDLEINIDAKWVAADNYCQMRGWDFKVITEQGLNILKTGRLV